MKSPSLAVSAVVCAAVLLGPRLAQGQPLPRDPAERARIIAQILEANARQLTLFDRSGQAVGTVGRRDLYTQPVFSPDTKRMAVIRPDLDKETNDLWVIEVATARATQVTSSKPREGANSPAWSPDGTTVAYVALRDGYFGLYRKALAAGGQEELLFKNSAPLTLTDWSQDGRYLVYFSTDLSGGAMFALPLAAAGERTPIEIFRSKFQAQGPRMSPDAACPDRCPATRCNGRTSAATGSASSSRCPRPPRLPLVSPWSLVLSPWSLVLRPGPGTRTRDQGSCILRA